MKEIEGKILQLLVQCENSPVEDENLVSTLQFSKKTAFDINTKMTQIQKIDAELIKSRESYRSVAKMGSILFFVIQDISMIDPMYQYSLQSIIKLFKIAIKITSDNSSSRVESIISQVKETIFMNVSRGIFEEHKIIFSFLILINIKLNSAQLD